MTKLFICIYVCVCLYIYIYICMCICMEVCNTLEMSLFSIRMQTQASRSDCCLKRIGTITLFPVNFINIFIYSFPFYSNKFLVFYSLINCLSIYLSINLFFLKISRLFWYSHIKGNILKYKESGNFFFGIANLSCLFLKCWDKIFPTYFISKKFLTCQSPSLEC